jgi:hypothetical protein
LKFARMCNTHTYTPISSVKRIMGLNADVHLVSGYAVTSVAQVDKLFIEHLEGKSMEVARKVCSRRKLSRIDRSYNRPMEPEQM